MKKIINEYAVIDSRKSLKYKTEKLTSPENDEVLIKIEACAICGSDKKLYKNSHPFVNLPAEFGHEFAGRVILTGENVNYINKNDRVTVEPANYCGRCDYCKKGNYNFCDDLSFFYREGKGGMAQYIKVPARNVYSLPSNISYEEGALIEPLAVSLHAWEKVSVTFSDSIIIIGCGAIGLLLVQLAKAQSCQNIYVLGRNQNKLKLAEELGADKTFVSTEGVVENILSTINKKGFDIVFDAVGKEIVLKQAFELLLPSGHLVNIGLYEEDVNLDYNKIINKELEITGAQGYCWNFQDAIKLVAKDIVKLTPMISDVFMKNELDKAMDKAISSYSKAIKIIYKPNKGE